MKLCICVLSVLLCSCQAGKELHYFKQGENYFRLRVTERAILSSSRYTSGYFDEDAVDRFFGEIHRPDTIGRVVPVSTAATKSETALDTVQAAATKRGTYKSKNIEGIPPKTKLVLILSTDASAVADQIGSLAENEQTLETIARLTHKSTIIENNKLISELQLTTQKNNSIGQMGDLFIGSLAVVDTISVRTQREKIKANVLTYINTLAASMGRKTPFVKLADAQEWYHDNF